MKQAVDNDNEIVTNKAIKTDDGYCNSINKQQKEKQKAYMATMNYLSYSKESK